MAIKVKDLIKKLQQCDPEHEVYVFMDKEDNDFLPLLDDNAIEWGKYDKQGEPLDTVDKQSDAEFVCLWPN